MPPSREGRPLWGHPAPTPPGDTERGGKGAPKPEFPGQPGLEAALIPGRAQQEIGGAASPAPGSGRVFTAPEARGVLNSQLLKGWPCSCAASSSVTPACHPHQPLSGKAKGSTSNFLNYHTKKTKRKPHQNSQKPAQPLSWGSPAKPSVWHHPVTARYEGETLLLFIAKWPFPEKFGGVSRSLGFGSSLEGAEASSEAGSNVSHGRGYAEGYFGTWEVLGYLWHQHQPRDPRCQQRKGRFLGASAAIMQMRD